MDKEFNNDNNNPNFIMMGSNDNKNEERKYEGNKEGFNFNKSPLYEKKPKRRRGIMSYVAVGVASALIGGIITTSTVLYALPKYEGFKNTELYKTLKGNQYTGPIPEFTSVKEGMTIPEVVQKVGPAVVGVSTKSISGDILFGQQVSEGIGSGAIINEEGYVLTNYHVIEGAQQVKVILNEDGKGKEVNAKVVNYDANRDIAVVKITDDVKIPAVATLGDSDATAPGQQVIAIGNPLGREFLGTVTQGIVSAVNRDIVVDNNGSTLKFIQTDTAINKGNSGGPLINAKGEIIGVNTLKTGRAGVEGMGFAIPINEIKPKLEDLLKPILKIGIRGGNVDEKKAKENNVPVGALVAEVQDFSPAQKAGIQPGDIITSFDGKQIKTMAEINDLKAKHKSGDTVKVEVYRGKETKTLELTLTE